MSGSLSTRLSGGSIVPSGDQGSAGRAPRPAVDVTRVGGRTDLSQLKARLQRQLIAELGEADLNTAQGRRQVEALINDMVEAEGLPLPRVERARLLEAMIAEVLAFGPIEPLLRDPSITEVMVNGPNKVWVERNGQLSKTDIRFEDDEHVRRIIDRIIAPLGRRCDEASPMVDARLPDGSRVNAIIPPLSLIGPVITIRKFSRDLLNMESLIRLGSISTEVANFLAACVGARINILISGGTGSGKTTLLNIMSSYIPSSERIVTIEDAAELQLRQDHVITLEKRPPNVEGRGEVTIRQLVVNALRMRPDRLIVGEVRGPEALDMLQAMNTGHDGSMTTLHSNSPRDTLARLETMVLMAGFDLPHRAIREQIASAVELIVHQDRMSDGSRRIVRVTEVQGMEQQTVVLQDVFAFQQSGIEAGRVVGRLAPIGIRPKFMDKLELSGVRLPPTLFQATPEPSRPGLARRAP
ncbi:MAG TPA: CpaF family protein [Chloroflexota bacterium]|nr:CpaF family protein [Chloroflexota bacterium]